MIVIYAVLTCFDTVILMRPTNPPGTRPEPARIFVKYFEPHPHTNFFFLPFIRFYKVGAVQPCKYYANAMQEGGYQEKKTKGETSITGAHISRDPAISLAKG